MNESGNITQRVFDQIAQTYTMQKRFDKSLEFFGRSETVLSEVIRLDEGNTEAQVDKFNLILRIGETETENGQYERAENTFRRALNFARSAPKLKEPPYTFYTFGLYQEDVSFNKRAQAEKDLRLPKQERLKLLEQAITGFQGSLEIWKEKIVELEEFGINEEKIKDTENRLSQCEKLAEQIRKL